MILSSHINLLFLFLVTLTIKLMNKKIFLTIFLLLSTSFTFAQTQFKATTYEKALALARRYNKPLLLDVATSNKPNADIYKLFQDKDLAAYISKNFITARISMDNEANKEFEEVLDHLIYPCVVFYSSRGEQLESSNWYYLVNGKEDLRELAQISLDNAAFKLENSRKIEFDSLSFDEAAIKAKKANKLLFVSNYYPKFHSYSMIVNDIFSQDKIADFYNNNFINIQIDNYLDNSLVEKYMGKESIYPNYMFFDGDGRHISTEQYHSVEDYISSGENAIKEYNENKEVHYSIATSLLEAITSNKPLFINFSYGTKEDNFLKTPYLARYINSNFSSLYIDATNNSPLTEEVKKRYNFGENSVYLFTDNSGKIIHKLTGNYSAEDFYDECELALTNKGLAHYNTLYTKGERSFDFIRNYTQILHKAGNSVKLEKVIGQYTNKLKRNDLLNDEVFNFIINEVGNLDDNAAQIFLTNYHLFETKFGVKASEYRKTLWINAFNDVTGENYSRAKLKSLTKRLNSSDMSETEKQLIKGN